MELDDYLDAATRRPWIYGGGEGGFRGHDCCLWPANWLLARSGVDPASDLRGSYSTKEEAEGLLTKAGRYHTLFAPRFAMAGWKSVREPETGDIGIIVLPKLGDRWFDFPAIRREDKWLVIDPRGTLALPGDLHATSVWRGAE